MPGNVYNQMGQQSGINTMPGLYRGRVEYNKDPRRVGRVRVRIPTLHGVPGAEQCLAYNELPWATPCNPFPCGNDYGSFVVPEVGTYVWVMFEAGDTSKPVYIGSMHSTDPQSSYPMGTFDTEKDAGSTRYKQSKGAWTRPAYQNEVPVDAYGTGDDTLEPSINVVYKSPKGATLVINEQDERESLSLIDRLGQALAFICPMTADANNYNQSRRRRRSIAGDDLEGGLLDTEKVSVLKKAVVILRGARDQFLRLVSKRGQCRSELVSKDIGNSASVLSLNSGEKKTILFSSSNGDVCYLELDSASNSIALVVDNNGTVMSRITLGANIQLWSTGSITSYDYQPPQSSDFNWSDIEDEDMINDRSDVDTISYPTDDAHDGR